MCIVNNRRHARELYQAVAGQPGTRHLTTCLCAAHRREVLAEIRRDLKDGRPVRLVATSLVEAGVDVSFPVVYRALAGLDSLAQAAGRCNRNGEVPGGGRVIVFESPEGASHRPPPELRQFAEVARSVLRTHECRHGRGRSRREARHPGRAKGMPEQWRFPLRRHCCGLPDH